MKIVIDISEEDYNYILSQGDTRGTPNIAKAICNGTVLPKEKTGHWFYVPYDGHMNTGIWCCSKCERKASFTYIYCPHCGTRMVSE